mgnify:CR=1 FL=1
MDYQPAEKRYETMTYRRCGRSGLFLPAISLGLWHNFGGVDVFENCRQMARRAFDLGITHFDLANNYGPPAGSAEETFGEILRKDLLPWRDQIVISTKAGYRMWDGPYGDGGSRKYLVASCDQSLKRLGVDYVDIFYHHRPDPETPVEETVAALDYIVRSGRALYAGISNYTADQTRTAVQMLRQIKTPCLVHQVAYNMFNRRAEEGLFDLLREEGVGCVAFSPLAQGLLSDRYLNGIPEGSRASKPHGFLKPAAVTGDKLEKVRKLNAYAKARGQTLARMALAWVLRSSSVTSALIGASRVSQIEDAVAALSGRGFADEELAAIDGILTSFQ